ncbi:MAG: hypothetical protein PHF37_10960 [Phycisphaerae bacterium]|nr:hypothetical protein [Phycisphaerae bacterium]
MGCDFIRYRWNGGSGKFFYSIPKKDGTFFTIPNGVNFEVTDAEVIDWIESQIAKGSPKWERKEVKVEADEDGAVLVVEINKSHLEEALKNIPATNSEMVKEAKRKKYKKKKKKENSE